MRFNDKFTTKEKLNKDPEKEKDKTELSNDAHALGELIELLTEKINEVRFNLLK